MHNESDFLNFMLMFLHPDFEKDSPTNTAIDWAADWEQEQHDVFRAAKRDRDIPSMSKAARSIKDSHHEWNPEIFIVFGKRKLQSVRKKLRIYIDEWIDSGFQPNGSEWPTKRNFKPKLRNAFGTATSLPKWNTPPEAFTPSPVAITALAMLHRGKAIPIGRRYEIEVEKDAKSSIEIRIGGDGGIDYFLRQEWLGSNAELRSAQIFYWFYRSSWIFLLMRCNRCKRLSMPKTRPRKSYERGWHCDKCRNSAAAQAATDAKRSELREKWMSLAVDAYREYLSKPHRSTNDLSFSIAEQVNKGLPHSKPIKRNTITRNLAKIQAEAKLKGAKHNAKS